MWKYFKKYFSIGSFWVLCSFLSSSAVAQFNVCGKVWVDKVPQKEVLIQIIDTPYKITTNENGEFCFKNIQKGKYRIIANYFGSRSDTLSFTLNKDINNYKIEIITPYLLDDVEVISKKETTRKAEHSIKTDIVDLKKYHRSSISTTQLMNSTAGIKVRTDGALGDDASIEVGGFNGKSVRFLVDGIPMDYLGSSMSITKIPTTMADHIEVYKGVLPTEIGIDALGAAINIVTKNPPQTNHKFSYEWSSYNTHRLSINSFVRTSEKFSYGVNAFMNYADNNFQVDDLPFENEVTGKSENITAPLFHNGYRQYSGDIFVNFEKRKWADLLKISVNSYALKRELQNDMTSRSRPFGQAHRKEQAYAVPSVQYKKSFLKKKLEISQFLVYSHINYALVDTVKNGFYDWKGDRHNAVSGSEMGTDLSNLKEPIIRTSTDNITYRGLFTYNIHKNHKLVLNFIENYLRRNADDLGEYDSKSLITYNRLIAGLGYQYSFFDEKIKGLTQMKYLNSQTTGDIKDMLYSNTIEYEEGRGISYNQGFSMAQSLKYQPTSKWLVRASIENTYRLPDQMEIFGDNVFIEPNLGLNPEKSFNLNASIRYKNPKWFRVEWSAYHRNTKEMIRLKDLTQFSAQYLNLDHVKGYGVELEAAVYPIKNLEISGNITYNEFRFQGSNDELAQNKHFIDARVSNMPFYFGNAQISYQFQHVFTKKDRDKLNVYWNYSYVHQYYLDFIEKQYEPDGFLGLFGASKVYTDRIIPIQQTHSVGLVWWLALTHKKVLSIGAEVRNLFDAKIYNHFKIQSMGRSFSVKLTYEI